ncbi:Gfo/Idh/MocA family protein [Novosphingobium rosa]|uniref:Gfo/Idh/MocA family protein n=1 Tax=Novosphingobium rosa TaxID=76978 RepID=UPI00082DB5E0|nr:Gfo/Idh/MocA family oxidoreductase [Novosphingobium rosa]
MTEKTIGVGLIGYEAGRSWAALAHVPALRGLPEYDIVGVATTRQESALAAAADIGLPAERGFASATALAACPQVDVVAVTVKVPHHLELVRAATLAGKHVYCEWPLGNGLAEAETMVDLVKQAGVRGVVGLQARCAPPIAYLRDLVLAGEIGEVLSTTMFGTGLQWGDWVDPPNTYLLDGRHGATLMTIPFGHAIDALCFCLGEFSALSAQTAIRLPKVRRTDTGEMLDKHVPDQIAVTGTLESGAVAAVHYRGGTARGRNFVWEIHGTRGELRLEAEGGHAQIFALTLSAGFGSDKQLRRLEIPAQYRWVPPGIDGPALNVAQLYRRLSEDLRSGSATATDFPAAVARHRLLASIEQAALSGPSLSL